MAHRAPSAEIAKQNRTKVGNGSQLHFEGDGRGRHARRFNELFQGISVGLLTEEQRQHARRASALALECEKIEGRISRGEEIDVEQFKQLCDACGRAFERLAAVRTPPPVPPPNSDGTPSTPESRLLASLSEQELDGGQLLSHTRQLEQPPFNASYRPVSKDEYPQRIMPGPSWKPALVEEEAEAEPIDPNAEAKAAIRRAIWGDER
jgi:hypothetical protein